MVPRNKFNCVRHLKAGVCEFVYRSRINSQIEPQGTGASLCGSSSTSFYLALLRTNRVVLLPFQRCELECCSICRFVPAACFALIKAGACRRVPVVSRCVLIQAGACRSAPAARRIVLIEDGMCIAVALMMICDTSTQQSRRVARVLAIRRCALACAYAALQSRHSQFHQGGSV